MSSEPWSFELGLPPGALRFSAPGDQLDPLRKPGLSPEVAQQVARGTGAYTDDLLEIFREYAQGCRTWSFPKDSDYFTLTVHRPLSIAAKVVVDLFSRRRETISLEIDPLEFCAGLVAAMRTDVSFVIPGSDASIGRDMARELCGHNMLGIE